jgi:hypothetical protein
MVLPLLVLFLGLQDNSQIQGELSRLRSDVQRLNSELSRTQTTLQNEMRPVCSAESRLHTGDLRITGHDMPVRATFFGMVSSPSESCLPANINISVTYFDPTGGFVCGGTTTIPQQSLIQNTALEFRPYELEVFLRWWDGPTLRQQTLICRDYQGNEMRGPTEYATSLKIFASLFPKRGGISTSELQLTLPRLPRRD